MGGELRKQKLGEHSPGTRRSYPTSNLYIFFFLASNRPPTSRGTTNLSFRKRKLFVSKLGQILGGVSPLPWQGTTETVLRPTLCPGRSRALKKLNELQRLGPYANLITDFNQVVAPPRRIGGLLPPISFPKGGGALCPGTLKEGRARNKTKKKLKRLL